MDKKISISQLQQELAKGDITHLENYSFLSKDLDPFWYLDQVAKQPKLKIRNIDFYLSLSKFGYRSYYNNQKDIQFCYIDTTKNIVYPKTINEIKTEIYYYLENSNLEETLKKSIIDLVIKNDKSLYNKDTLAYLELLDEGSHLQSTTKKSYQFFKNCFVCIENGEIEVQSYEVLASQYLLNQGPFRWVWSYEIKNRNFELNQNKEYLEKGNIYQFVKNTQNKDEKRFKSFCKTIGYLVKGYHSAIERKIVVFVDGNNTNSNINNGRRGKTVLLRDIISQYTPTTILNSSRSNPTEDKFWLSSYKPGDRIIAFNDIDGKNTELRPFYTLTDGFDVERKGKDKIILQDNEVPAIVITCNHLPKYNPEESSSLARLQIVEFTDYYNINHTPYQDFGCELGKWDSDSQEWALFDNFMIYCLTEYIKHGLDKSEPKDAIHVALESQIGEDRIAVLDEMTKDKTEVILNKSFECEFNELLGFDTTSDDYFEKKKLIDKKHLEIIFSKYAAVKGFTYIETIKTDSGTRRSKKYKKKT